MARPMPVVLPKGIPSRFREWDWYDFEVDTSHCDRGYPGVAHSIITVKDKKTGETVWRFGVKLDPSIAEVKAE